MSMLSLTDVMKPQNLLEEKVSLPMQSKIEPLGRLKLLQRKGGTTLSDGAPFGGDVASLACRLRRELRLASNTGCALVRMTILGGESL